MTYRPPVVFMVFNRPDLTARVFEAIRAARPEKLLVIGDGPRPDHPQDTANCAAVRAIVEGVDWPCEVLKNYSETNLGCGVRVATGLTWAFSQVEEAIVLEDDCLPHPSFFLFCAELLQRYRDDERVMHITGDNFQNGWMPSGGASYYFSRFNHVWGWASWRRAWKHYDFQISHWPRVRQDDLLAAVFAENRGRRYWMRIFDGLLQVRNTWDYQWTFACWLHGGLTATPVRNLVSNIGFREGATHTKGPAPWAEMPVFPVHLPLVHPLGMSVELAADRRVQTSVFKEPFMAVVYRLLMRLRGKHA